MPPPDKRRKGIGTGAKVQARAGRGGGYRWRITWQLHHGSDDGYAASLPKRELKLRPGAIASEALDRERFEAGASSESETREPRTRSEVDRVCRARRPANLKTCKQVRAKYFYEACPSAARADATGVKAPARHPSQYSDPRFRCSMGDVSSTIASSALPPGRLIVRVLSSGREASRATPHHAERSHRAHHSHAEETTSRSKTVSIDQVDASMGLAHR